MGWLGIVARLVVGGVWIAAGALKLPDPTESVRAVRGYRLLPEAVVPAIGHGLPILELIVGVCLVLGLLVRPMAVVSTLMLLAFVVGISSAWARGLSIECGCFGGGGGSVPRASEKYFWDLLRDFGLMLLSGWLVYRPTTRWALDSALIRG